MHVLIESASSAFDLAMISGSARNGRAMETMSAHPDSRAASHASGVFRRLVVISGIDTSPMSFFVTNVKPPLGTKVAIVGMRASCQPIPVLMASAPASSAALANATTSFQSLPSAIKSSMLRRYTIANCGPTAARISRMISSGKRMRFSKEPPYSSVR